MGLGGAGTNVVEAFLESDEVFSLLSRGGVKFSCLALDVADHDIVSLQKASERFKEKLKQRGISAEKLSVTARSVKFPTPEVMFEFMQKYPDFLEKGKARIPTDYHPWLTSSMEIPPLSGGVGRRRSLSKAIYGLNYYYLGLVDGYMDSFKEQVSGSTVQPVIFVIFGVGGGSGSGIVVDFARHLRKKLGSGFPIIGLGILPCIGDDPPAKGVSALAAINELELMLDKSKNDVVKATYGQIYENPFTSFIMMPLGPAFSKTGSLLDAKKFVDESIVDLIVNSMRFDLSDLLNNIGASLDVGDRWVHTVTTLKISYPINDYIKMIKLQLDKLDLLRISRKEKLEMYAGEAGSGTGGIHKILDLCMQELADVTRQWFIQRGIYEEKTSSKALNDYIYEDKSLELNFNMQVKGIEDLVRNLLEEVTNPVMAVGIDSPEGTPEARVRSLVNEVVTNSREISKTHGGYHELRMRMVEDLNSSVAGAQKLTVKQKLLVGDVADFIVLVDDYLGSLRKYMEAKALADRLSKELSRADKSEQHQEMLTTVQRIQNPELVTVFSLLPSFLQNPSVELKTIDSNLSNLKVMHRILSERVEKIGIDSDSHETKLRGLQNEADRISREIRKLKIPIVTMGKKKVFQEKREAIEQDIHRAMADKETTGGSAGRIREKASEYAKLQRKLDVNSDYRRLLQDALDSTKEYYERLTSVSKDKGHYDRTAEITPEERLKIMQKILMEEEEALTRETILREIVDRKHLKEYLYGTLRILRLPSALGLTTEFRTDYIWVTVVVPRGIWEQDLASELRTALSGYITGDATRCITIREVDSKDPWTLRFLVIASKARANDLEVYEEMRKLYMDAGKSDRLLSHSLLLEQNVVASEEFVNGITEGRKYQEKETQKRIVET